MRELTLDQLRAFEARVAAAMRARDPEAAFAAMASDDTLHEALRAAAAAVRPAGVRLSALLVAKVRFERLVQGSTEASEWFDDDPAGFARAFRDYHEAVPPRSFFPAAEARAFEAWLDARG